MDNYVQQKRSLLRQSAKQDIYEESISMTTIYPTISNENAALLWSKQTDRKKRDIR